MRSDNLPLALGAAALLITSACGGDDDTSSPDPISTSSATTNVEPDEEPDDEPDGEVSASAPSRPEGGWYRPPVDATWQWQLDGELDTSYDVDVYDIDLFDTPTSTIAELHERGIEVICYFSAGSFEDWRDDVDAFSSDVLGESLDGWEGERWLDIRSADVLDVMTARLDLARDKGCDGVEPDNVQAHHSDTGFDLTADDQITYNRALASAAHERGLAIGLKNAADLIPDLVDDFDFSVNEECHEYEECEPYAAFVEVGKPVFNAEYADEWATDEAARAELCERARAAGVRTLVLPLDLDGSFRFACDA